MVACWHKPVIKEAIMSDNLNNRGPQDRAHINVNETWEVTYWTKELGVSKEELEKAVKAAGTQATAVRRHLGQ
jgi:hypothetical protein